MRGHQAASFQVLPEARAPPFNEISGTRPHDSAQKSLKMETRPAASDGAALVDRFQNVERHRKIGILQDSTHHILKAGSRNAVEHLFAQIAVRVQEREAVASRKILLLHERFEER